MPAASGRFAGSSAVNPGCARRLQDCSGILGFNQVTRLVFAEEISVKRQFVWEGTQREAKAQLDLANAHSRTARGVLARQEQLARAGAFAQAPLQQAQRELNEAEATLVRFHSGTTGVEVLQACLEAVAYRIAIVSRLLRAHAAPGHEVVASGGAMGASPARGPAGPLVAQPRCRAKSS